MSTQSVRTTSHPWVLGVALGAGTGLPAGSLGYLALIAAITGFGVVAIPRSSGPSAISGLCVGFGAVFAGLLAAARARCDPAS